MSPKKEFLKKDRFQALEKAAEKINDKTGSIKDISSEEAPVISRFSQMESQAVADSALQQIPLAELYPAPAQWNFYEILPQDKMVELMESIQEVGLLHPLIVWKQEKGYMILSGHNRKQAYQNLYAIHKNKAYSHIPCIVKEKGEIDEETAREIIIDTNWIQRQLSTLEKAKSISEKYIRLGRKSHSGDGQKSRDIVAADYGISGRMVQNYLSLTDLIPELEGMLRENHLTIKNAVRLSRLDPSIQRWLYEEFSKEELSSAKVRSLDKQMNKKEILSQLRVPEDYVKVQIKVKKQDREAFLQMAKQWLKNR